MNQKNVLLSLVAFFAFFSSIAGQGWMKNLHTLTVNSEAFCTITHDNGLLIARFADNTFEAIRLDTDGSLLWKKAIPTPSNQQQYPIASLVAAADGGFLIGDNYSIGDSTYLRITKLDDNGNFLWDHTLPAKLFDAKIKLLENQNEEVIFVTSELYDSPKLYRISKTGNVLLQKEFISIPNTASVQRWAHNSDQTYTMSIQDQFKSSWYKIDDQGNILSSFDHVYASTTYTFVGVEPTSDGGYIAVFNSPITNTNGSAYLRKFDGNGNQDWTRNLGFTSRVVDFELSSNDEIYTSISSGTPEPIPIISKRNTIGAELWSKSFDRIPFDGITLFPDIEVDNSGNVFASGSFFPLTIPGPASYSIGLKLTNDGILYSSYIKGKVNYDTNNNCTTDTSDQVLEKYLVYTDGPSPFYGFTDNNGEYIINVDTGTYVVSTLPFNALFTSCNNNQQITLASEDTLEVNFLEQAATECPYLLVDISAPRLVRCFDNTYYIKYCNQGSMDAQNAYIEVTFDQYTTVLNSSIPITTQTGNTFTFDLGTVQLFDCGQFTIETNLDCDSTVLGQTHCAEAHIYPDSTCFPPSPLWDGSITTLDASCVLDSVLLEIENTGSGGMTNQQNYIIAEDNIIKENGLFQLQPAEKRSFKFPANGSTYRLTAEQAPGYFPPNYIPTITIEGCGFDSINQQYSIGYVTQFAENDGIPYLSIDCQENVGSYDPNDKRAEPKGYGPQHYIEANTDLEYHIRFQNIGTDTAYNVVVRDTLSPHLNIQTLQVGVSSHPFVLDIVNGNILKFSFNDIKLVDSTTNEPGSNGFMKFKIAQQSNLPIGTIINNSAAVYFDYNEPVITNTTFHEIGEDFVEVLINNDDLTYFPSAQVIVYPNPISETATMEVIDGPDSPMLFVLCDALGRTILKDEFERSLQFQRKNLLPGVYFFSIQLEGSLVKQGKIIIQ